MCRALIGCVDATKDDSIRSWALTQRTFARCLKFNAGLRKRTKKGWLVDTPQVVVIRDLAADGVSNKGAV